MTKRRINKQQITRIQKIQDGYRHADSLSTSKNGLVIRRFGKHVEIEDEQNKRINCSIRPNLDSLVAGDRVRWQPEGDKQGVVISCYPRQTVLKRPAKNDSGKPIAANISQLMITVAPKPEISWLLLDSYLVIAETLGISAVIVLNKADLPCKSIKTELISSYQNDLNYPVILANHNNYVEIEKQLADHVSVFVGQSGVGKSSIISGVLSDETIQIGEISSQSQLGCHTTINSYFYHLPLGGALIDSPGIREFALWNMGPEELVAGFKEFKALVGHCKYRNCCHQHSQGCAFLDAIKQGQISPRRYENLLSLIKNYGL